MLAGWRSQSLQKLLPREAIRAMLQTPEGTLIGPVPGPDGFMLFRVLARKPGEVTPFQDCRDAVQQDYLNEHGAELVDRYLEAEGRTSIKIESFPKNIANISNDQRLQGVERPDRVNVIHVMGDGGANGGTEF